MLQYYHSIAYSGQNDRNWVTWQALSYFFLQYPNSLEVMVDNRINTQI